MEDGASKREHLISGWRQSGIMPDELKEFLKYECPPECAGVWHKFQELHGSRSVGMAGPGAITFLDIQAWRTVTGRGLEPWELRAILRLDLVYRAHVAASAKSGG